MRRSSVMAAVLLIGLLVLPSWAGAQVRVLLLPACPSCDSVPALSDALAIAGYEVEVFPEPEFRWDGTNPPLDGFDVLIHHNGATFHTPLPVESQLALVEFVQAGGTYIGTQYNGFEQASGQQVDMPELTLQLWPRPDNCSECEMTWTVVPGQEDHPVLDGVPGEFSFFADGHDAGPLVVFDEDPSTVLMNSPAGGPAVIVRELGEGQVVTFSFAPNTSTALTLLDPIIQQLYINAVAWEPVSSEPTIESLQEAVDELADSGALNPIQKWVLDRLLLWADRLLESGRTRGAAIVLEGFARQIEWWIRTGELTEEEGRPLVDDARAIIAGSTS